MLNRAFRTALCAGALLLALCLPASAAQEGDFSVLVNGEAVTFTDAAPLLKDGRSFLPMVETFDALGFAQGDITWDAATRSVTAAKDDTSITLTIDQKELTVTRGQENAAETDTITTDAAPFIDAASSRTYVPVGLVAGALGYNVGWDAQTSTVIIDDVDFIVAATTETYADDIEALLAGAHKLVPDLDCRHVVRAFAGGRAVIRGLNDFMIRRSSCRPGHIQAAGIQSPGVASAPAIAERVEELVREEGLALAPRADWDPHRCAPTDFDTASLEQQQALIELDPAWGRIVCRCETVPEAEIVEAIRRDPGAVSVEGVKRRCRAGMGRCQSGFCQSKVVRILARELECDPWDVPLEDAGSPIVYGPVKEGR